MKFDNSSGESRLTNRRRAELRSLHRSKGRRDLGQYLIEGVRPVESALDASVALVEVVVAFEQAGDSRIAKILERAACPVLFGSARDLDGICDVQTTQGIVAVGTIPPPGADPVGPCLLLDGIQDPGNVGALIRTAAWFGAGSVVCGPGTADPWQPKAVRAAMGGLWDLRVVRVDDLTGLLTGDWVRGKPIYVADMAGTPVGEWHPERDAVLVLGSEAHGPGEATLAAATERVHIPRSAAGPATESLNAAVASGILMFAWLGSA